jgi:hypothetical protein
MLNPKILSTLKKKTERKEKTIRNNISSLRRDYSSLPLNSCTNLCPETDSFGPVEDVSEDFSKMNRGHDVIRVREDKEAGAKTN